MQSLLILAIAVALIAGAIWCFKLALPKFPRKTSLATPGRLGANVDLRHFSRAGSFPAWWWLVAIVVSLLLTLLFSWTSKRDDQARHADRIARNALRDTRLTEALKLLRCPPADAPLEKLLVTVGTQADGKAPKIFCTYVTADLGVVPRIRFAKPQVFAQQ
jgi:hypothetical protein